MTYCTLCLLLIRALVPQIQTDTPLIILDSLISCKMYISLLEDAISKMRYICLFMNLKMYFRLNDLCSIIYISWTKLLVYIDKNCIIGAIAHLPNKHFCTNKLFYCFHVLQNHIPENI